MIEKDMPQSHSPVKVVDPWANLDRRVIMPKTAMILAAGRGLRMRHLTEEVPKPLLQVGERPIIDWIIDRLLEAGVETIVVNLSYHGDKIRDHVESRNDIPNVLFSQEQEALETGGGIRKALPLLGPDPVILVNGDTIWLDGPTPMLYRLARRFDPHAMDALMLMIQAPRAPTYRGRGDYFMQEDGQVERRRKQTEIAPYVYASVQIAKPDAYAHGPEGAFRAVEIWDRQEKNERLFGLVHDGLWFSPNTPEQLAAIDPLLIERNARWLD